MKNNILNCLLFLRAYINRVITSGENNLLGKRSLKPLSRKFGLDRGTPIDRYYIQKYLEENKESIKGHCLEIGDDRYIKEFGKNSVTSFEILDVNIHNKQATIIDDLRKAKKIKDNTFDCIILTQVIGMIDDCESVINTCHRILKKNGVLLITTSALSPNVDLEYSYWRFTVASIKYLLEKKFKKSKITVKSYGNVLTGQAFWVGVVQEELTKKELDYNDEIFPLLIAGKAVK